MRKLRRDRRSSESRLSAKPLYCPKTTVILRAGESLADNRKRLSVGQRSVIFVHKRSINGHFTSNLSGQHALSVEFNCAKVLELSPAPWYGEQHIAAEAWELSGEGLPCPVYRKRRCRRSMCHHLSGRHFGLPVGGATIAMRSDGRGTPGGAAGRVFWVVARHRLDQPMGG